VAVGALVLLTGACGDRDPDEAVPGDGCGADTPERVDPGSAIHVLAGAPEPEYATDPPTSGPHAPGPPRTGVLDEPLSRPEQVGHLEAGGVLIQYGELDDESILDLATLAGEGVAIAPNPDLPAPVVATAWTRALRCGAVDTGGLQDFIDAHLGNGPGTD
jgi:hypothetical protein